MQRIVKDEQHKIYYQPAACDLQRCLIRAENISKVESARVRQVTKNPVSYERVLVLKTDKNSETKVQKVDHSVKVIYYLLPGENGADLEVRSSVTKDEVTAVKRNDLLKSIQRGRKICEVSKITFMDSFRCCLKVPLNR